MIPRARPYRSITRISTTVSSPARIRYDHSPLARSPAFQAYPSTVGVRARQGASSSALRNMPACEPPPKTALLNARTQDKLISCRQAVLYAHRHRRSLSRARGLIPVVRTSKLSSTGQHGKRAHAQQYHGQAQQRIKPSSTDQGYRPVAKAQAIRQWMSVTRLARMREGYSGYG